MDGRLYQSHHAAVLNDPRIKAIRKSILEMPTPKELVGYPLNHEEWELGFQKHEDRNYVAEILRRNRIGKGGGWPITENLDICAPGAAEGYPGTIELWVEALRLMEERTRKGYFLGPFEADKPLPKWLTDKAIKKKPLFHPLFGKVEIKADGTRKTRLLFDLSNDSRGLSFNDNIHEGEKTVTYITILDVCRRIVDCDMKWIWCLDALEAYYRVPIQERFIPLMGVKVCNILFFFTCLVMGQATACKLYTEFATAVVWIIVNNSDELFKWKAENAKGEGVVYEMIMHYIDDFMGGAKDKEQADRQFETVKEWWRRLGIPTQDRKCTPPANVMRYLGFIFDALRRTVAVPKDKLKKYKKSLQKIKNHHKAPSRRKGRSGKKGNGRKMELSELLTLIGQLRSMQYVYRYMAPALRNLEEVAARHPMKRRGRVRVDTRVMQSVKLIEAALEDARLNEVTMKWLLHPRDAGDVEIYTDASTSTGVGGFEDERGGRFYGVQWKETTGWGVNMYAPDITYLELLGVVAAAKLYGAKWREKSVRIRCDNMAVCMMVSRKAACFRRRDLNALILILCELATRHRFHFWIVHVPGKENKLADKLSRDSIENVMKDAAEKDLAEEPSDAVGVVNELLDTWREHAEHVTKARFAEKRRCKCKREDAASRRQCSRLNEELPRNAAFDAITTGNRRQRRAHKQWKSGANI